MNGWSDWRGLGAVAAAAGRGRDRRPQQARRDRRDVVVAAVHRSCSSPSASARGCSAGATTRAAARWSSSTSSRASCSRRCRAPATRPTGSGSGQGADRRSSGGGSRRRWPRRRCRWRKLLAGEMPHDIEDVFASCKLTLFPRSHAELKASCTCPDWENPCKHVAAAYYILAEQLRRGPVPDLRLARPREGRIARAPPSPKGRWHHPCLGRNEVSPTTAAPGRVRRPPRLLLAQRARARGSPCQPTRERGPRRAASPTRACAGGGRGSKPHRDTRARVQRACCGGRAASARVTNDGAGPTPGARATGASSRPRSECHAMRYTV